jgi:ribose-phosphate pyrophosphokinase
MLLAFSDEHALARALAAGLGEPLTFIAEHRFPDGEIRLTLPPELPARVRVLRGLQ